jgi:hypothetical protein
LGLARNRFAAGDHLISRIAREGAKPRKEACQLSVADNSLLPLLSRKAHWQVALKIGFYEDKQIIQGLFMVSIRIHHSASKGTQCLWILKEGAFMKLIYSLSLLLIFSLSLQARTDLRVFSATVVEREDPEAIENWGSDCSIYCAISPTVSASSNLPPKGSLKYGAEQAHDFDLKTAWVEGKDDDGIGEYLEYTYDLTDLSDSRLALTSITLFNGYRKTRELWKDNSRVKSLKLYVNGKPYAIIRLKDKYNFQTAAIGRIKLAQGRKTLLRFEIMEIYKGDKYADTAIAELEFDGTGHH